jgi:hypothetical protein
MDVRCGRRKSVVVTQGYEEAYLSEDCTELKAIVVNVFERRRD